MIFQDKETFILFRRVYGRATAKHLRVETAVQQALEAWLRENTKSRRVRRLIVLPSEQDGSK